MGGGQPSSILLPSFPCPNPLWPLASFLAEHNRFLWWHALRPQFAVDLSTLP